ncbi:MAG TPA: ATP-binding protein [Oculatellaceae cyanobacterium]|jgi:anti-sigma regulatory factor (Ser/Thr protein kinase)
METLTVPGTLDSLKPIADYVISAAASAGLNKKASYNLRLAVDEVATNIIIHGYEEAGREGMINLWGELDEQALSIFIEDTAVEYNPFETDQVEEDELKLPLEERKLGGLGVYLAIQGVDKFLYERVDNHNRNIFVMKRMST